MHGATDIVLISVLISIAASYSISSPSNPLGIDYEPAPSPEDGPPLSAGALRNKAYLPAEIGGIVGAYVLIVATALIAICTVGRRLRREKRLSRKPTDVEMIVPPYAFHFPEQFQPDIYPEQYEAGKQQQQQSPITPISSATAAKNFSWPSPEKTDRNPYIFPVSNTAISPVGSDPSVDISVVQADREQLHRGLEDIYMHVMAQEAAKAAGVELPPPPMPMYRSSQGSIPPVAPQRLTKKNDKTRPATLDVEASKKPQSRASSFISSLKSPRKKTRELQISSPIMTPLENTFPTNYASDEEPLSPRYYSPPPAPPAPHDHQSGFPSHSRNNSNDPSPTSPSRSIAEQLSSSHISNPAPFQHRLNQPSQSSIRTTNSNSNSVRNVPPPITTQPTPHQPMRSPLAQNPLPALKTQTSHLSNSTAGSANASTRTLPFRAFDPPPGLASPTFSQMTRTTVLERTTPLSPGLRTPWTAGAVPYSPYQPQTPLIPVTPRLVTKEDRKRMKRQQKRAPVQELVEGEEEMWDSGY